ncbi:MAG: hypothetical protein AB8B71_14330 [Paracoccaceae bacterium]
MTHKTRLIALFLSAGLGGFGPVFAQSEGAQDTPLSAIEWLHENPDMFVPVAQPPDKARRKEPPVGQNLTTPDVTVTPLDAVTRKRIGLLPFDITGLPPGLWRDSTAKALDSALKSARSQRLPIGQELLLSVLLAEADDLAPGSDPIAWQLARIDALIDTGAVDPAHALILQTDPSKGARRFTRWMDLALLTRSEAQACAAAASQPSLAPNAVTRIYCTARLGDVDTAALLFGTTAALGDFSPLDEALLARFLDPDLFEDTPLPRAGVRPSALTFRLFEAAGARLSTQRLPLAFAHTDLSGEAGWKAQLEAAERLARAGVMSSNQLLGLYTDRKPAASGGIWDRVQAVQVFERALRMPGAKDLDTALPALWRSMQAAGLEVVFSDLFADALTERPLGPSAANIAFRMQLLSQRYEAALPRDATDQSALFLTTLAAGQPDITLASTDMARAVAGALSASAKVSQDLIGLTPGQTGMAVLKVLARLSAAGRGDVAALSQALTDLRALGLEDAARRAGLQALILLDRG